MASEPDSEDWKRYPTCLPSNISGDSDLEAHRKRLYEHSAQIFMGHGDVEVWTSNRFNQGEKIKVILQDCDEVHGQTEPVTGKFQVGHIDTTEDNMYFFEQSSSWSPIRTSVEEFQKLVTAHAVSPVVLDSLYSFGAKVTGDDDPFFNLCYQEIHCSPEQSQDSYYEICHMLRTFERHGRTGLKDPWSLRQMAVYQKYSFRTQKSVWILIQPFQKCKAALLRHFPRSENCANPMDLHSLLMSVAPLNWRWYLNDIRRQIFQFNEKATKSSLCIRKVDYSTDFSDCQRLQGIMDKLLLVQEVLESSIEVALMLDNHYSHLEKLRIPTFQKGPEFSSRIKHYIQRARSFQRTATALIKQTEGTSQLLSKLLSYRKADILNVHAESLRTINSVANAQSAMLADLAQKSRRDSRSTRIITAIATIYLPASLIASIFSTDLIHVPTPLITSPTTLLSVQKAIWVYVLASISLTALTVALAFLWERRARWKVHQSKMEEGNVLPTIESI